MANDFYSKSGTPATGSAGASSEMRSEFASVEAGFDKLATLTGNGDKPVFINTSGTAQEAITAASARAKLGLAIGTDVQAYDADLAALAALVTAADKLPYFTGAGAAALADFTAAARTLLAATSAALQRAALGSSVVGDAVFIAASAAAARSAIGAVIGTDVQAYDAELAAIAGLVSAADRVPYFTGSGTAALATFTAAGRALVAEASAAAQLALIGGAALSGAAFTGHITVPAGATGSQVPRASETALVGSPNTWTAAQTFNSANTHNGLDVFSAGVSITGGKVQFPATQVASADANALDDYEEGTFTPSLQFAAGTTGITYSSRSGKYTKIGNVVHFTISVQLSSKGSSTGLAAIYGISGLFTPSDECAVSLHISSCTYTGTPIARVLTSPVCIVFEQVTEAGTLSSMTDTNFTNTSLFKLSGIFFV